MCAGLTAALDQYGPPEQILTDNGRVFTGKFFAPTVEVRFDAICRKHGIEHLLTRPRSPTTTGKIERFHHTLRAEFDTRQVFNTLRRLHPSPLASGAWRVTPMREMLTTASACPRDVAESRSCRP